MSFPGKGNLKINSFEQKMILICHKIDGFDGMKKCQIGGIPKWGIEREIEKEIKRQRETGGDKKRKK